MDSFGYWNTLHGLTADIKSVGRRYPKYFLNSYTLRDVIEHSPHAPLWISRISYMMKRSLPSQLRIRRMNSLLRNFLSTCLCSACLSVLFVLLIAYIHINGAINIGTTPKCLMKIFSININSMSWEGFLSPGIKYAIEMPEWGYRIHMI